MFTTALSISFWQKLIELDKSLFTTINNGTANPVFDLILPWLRDSSIWAPFYIFLFALVLINFKNGWVWCIGFLCTVALTDLIGTYGFKENFYRLRPCQDPLFAPYVRLVIKQCSASYSFISNHAANHFGLAMFIYLTFRHIYNRYTLLIFIWPLIISYAQVYVGVHYPADVMAGAGVGILIGLFTSLLFNKLAGSLSLYNERNLNGNSYTSVTDLH